MFNQIFFVIFTGMPPDMMNPEMMSNMSQPDDNANEIDIERIMEEVKQVPSALRQELMTQVITTVGDAHLATVVPTHKKVAEANERFAKKMSTMQMVSF